jgi:predicted site-specific integrase-resolvase
MAKQTQPLSTREFSAQSGIPASRLRQLVREGKIKAEKKAGKWWIQPDQLELEVMQTFSKPPKTPVGKKSVSDTPSAPAPSKTTSSGKAPLRKAKTYSIAEFAEMTYLTEQGVSDWLRAGRLSGQKTKSGEWRVNADSLAAPHLRHLIRE